MHDWPEDEPVLPVTYDPKPALQVLQAIHEPTSGSMEHLNWEDNDSELCEVFGHPLNWSNLRSLTLAGFTVPNYTEFLANLAPFNSSLRELHLRTFNIRDWKEFWAPWKWEPLLQGLREEYNLTSFSIANFFADDDVGDGPQCGRWRVYKTHNGSYDLAHWGPILDIQRMEKLLADWVLGGDSNPFELYMEH